MNRLCPSILKGAIALNRASTYPLSRTPRLLQLAKLQYSTAAPEAALETPVPPPPAAPEAPAAPVVIEPPPNAEHIRSLAKKLRGLDLVEMMYICEIIKQEFNLGDDALESANATAQPAGDSKKEEEKPKEKTEFTVKLEGYPADAKLKIVKQVRTVMPELSIVEAKNIVEGVPKVLKQKVSKADAEKMKAKMEEVGAKIVIE